MILVADASSDLCTKSFPWEKHGVVYCHTQKNLGPTGVCVTVIRQDLIKKPRPDCPALCEWEWVRDSKDTLPTTPTGFSIYVMGLILKEMVRNGLRHYETLVDQRSKVLYDTIDASSDYYINSIPEEYRSFINVTFRIKNDK